MTDNIVTSSEPDGRPTDEPARNARRSPQEAFDDLRGSIQAVQRQVAQLTEVNDALRDQVQTCLSAHPAEAAREVLESLLRLYDILFTKVSAMESGGDAPDGFVVNLLQNVEGELLRHGAEVIRPRPGEKVNLDVMVFANALPCAWWREPDTVARIHQCGFAVDDGDGPRVIRKARVDVYRRQ